MHGGPCPYVPPAASSDPTTRSRQGGRAAQPEPTAHQLLSGPGPAAGHVQLLNGPSRGQLAAELRLRAVTGRSSEPSATGSDSATRFRPNRRPRCPSGHLKGRPKTGLRPAPTLGSCRVGHGMSHGGQPTREDGDLVGGLTTREGVDASRRRHRTHRTLRSKLMAPTRQTRIPPSAGAAGLSS